MREVHPVLKYPGSKWRIAEWIVSMMPEHKSYLEPFFGSGAVFFTKKPSRIETINDLDGEIVNLFRVIRERSEELERAVALTPYSRKEYEAVWERKNENTDPVERARRTLIRYWQTHGSRSTTKTGWKNDRCGREYSYAVRYWNCLPAWIRDIVERLKEAQIECISALDCIRRFSAEDVLIYADPPYLLETRKGPQYCVEMGSREEHEELLEVLKAHPGPVMLSGYESALYDAELKDWIKMSRKSCCEKGGKRQEIVWMNFEPQESLWEGMIKA